MGKIIRNKFVKIKGCPICGGKPVFITGGLGCRKFNMVMKFDSKISLLDAVERWNTRSVKVYPDLGLALVENDGIFDVTTVLPSVTSGRLNER